MSDLDIAEAKSKELEEARKILAAQEFGRAVAQRRKELRWSQQKLAEALNTSQPVVSEIERGVYLLTLDLVSRLARVLKVNPNKLSNAYWQVESQEFIDKESDVLDHIREIISEFYQIGESPGPQPPNIPAPTQLHPFNPNQQAMDIIETTDKISDELNPKPAPKPRVNRPEDNKSN